MITSPVSPPFSKDGNIVVALRQAQGDKTTKFPN